MLLVLMPYMRLVALRDRARLVPAMLRRFIGVIWASIATIVFTGLYRVFLVMHITTIDQLTAGPYGQILTMKLTLVVVLIGIAASVTLRVYPRIAAHVATHEGDEHGVYTCPACGGLMGAMRRHLTAGLGIALVIILLAAALRGA